MGSRVGIVGTGYVGLTTGACLSLLGHDVVCFDTDRAKVDALRCGRTPIHEPGLDAIVASGLRSGRLAMGCEPSVVWDREFVLLCLPTPTASDGTVDMGCVRDASRSIAPHLSDGSIVVVKSTLPVGSLVDVADWLGRPGVGLASNPEFLREGAAVDDCLHPDRIVIGADDPEVAESVASLYQGIDAPIVITDPASAQLAKYVSNAFLATRVSFVNGVATLCDAVGADPTAVLSVMGLDPRIGPRHLTPGPGWGGSCFPKDTTELRRLARTRGIRFGLIDEAARMNDEHIAATADGVAALAGGDLTGRRTAVWGLTFKAGTDDRRDSPAMAIVEHLVSMGADVRAHDPTVPAGAAVAVGVEVCADPYAACDGSEVLAVLTEWDDYRRVDLARVAALMARPNLFDTRGLLHPADLDAHGFRYRTIGRPRR